MQKLKSINFSGLLRILKCSLFGVVTTLIGIVLLAVILKFVDLSSVVINYINDIIKSMAIFIMILAIKRGNAEKLIINSVIGGTIYAILSFCVFSILNGKFYFDLSFVYDLLFAVIVSAITAIIINIMKKRTV